MRNSKNLLSLFLTFLKIGALTFGGGYAMLPIMEREVVEKKGWVNKNEILDMLVISESTPGVLAVNAATYIGYRVGKFWGALLATLGVILPAIIIISTISFFLDWFKSIEYVNYAFKGIRAGVAVLIFFSVFKLGKGTKLTIFTVFILLIAFLVAFLTKVNVIIILLCAAFIGIIFGIIIDKKRRAK